MPENHAAHGDLPKFVARNAVSRYVQDLGDTFALVRNPPYIFPAYEAYPLAPPQTVLADGLEAVVMDMDGTTTTTEALCIESLATMTACMTGRGREGASGALDPPQDYPHIIGNSTTRHVEYLLQRYRERIVPEAVCRHFIRAAAWNMTCGIDDRRATEAKTALVTQGLDALRESPLFRKLRDALQDPSQKTAPLLDTLTAECLPRLKITSIADLTRIGIEIYYQHYHELLAAIGNRQALHGEHGAGLIEPMPGIGIALALLKGWLGRDAGLLSDRLRALLPYGLAREEKAVQKGLRRFEALGAYFGAHPVKIALVTSSIATEATLVLREVFRAISAEVAEWEVPQELRERIQAGFSDPGRFYDACITATDSSEIRLKPHRDLYAIALHALGIPPERFHRVAGFEDSESGTIAIRAAGISLCCALPFAMTEKHVFEAATRVCPGGMPEVVLLEHFFLPDPLPDRQD